MRRLVVCLVAAMMASGAFAATTQLNPTVKVLSKPQSVVPTDCDEGLAPAAPRAPIETSEVVTPANVAPPPSSDLRTRLRRLQTAADREDHEAFKGALAEVRSGIAAFPGGGERDAANDVLQVYADLERLWDYSFSARTGAFFDANTQDGALLNALRRYPDYQRSIAGQTMTIGGQTIYPSRESRQFLVNEAAKRLTRLGVRTPTRLAQQPKVGRASSRPQAMKRTPHPASGHTLPASRGEGIRKAKRPPVKIAEAKPKPKPRPAPRHEEPVATPMPSTPPPPAPTPTPTPIPATATTAAPPTTTTAAPPPTATTATTATESTASTPPTTTQPQQTPKPQAGVGMNLMFAVILIVVGIGVLIVLFRASD